MAEDTKSTDRRRRTVDRRTGRDRREEIRFEPGKDDRREQKDRRRTPPWNGKLR